jgi:ArsR family transcriptional regulator
MEINDALRGLTALSQETRLWVFRLLVQAGPDGLSAGEISDALNSKQNTMSSHLSKLNRAGLISRHRQGRSIVYRANFSSIRGLVNFLMEDCCAGALDSCKPTDPATTQA